MGSQMTIGELIGSIRKGDLILPEFQRGYVWNRDQVREYLSSLYRGYPSGSFLIWRTPTPGLIRGAVQTSEGSVFQLILDGQQRLTTAYALFEGAPPPFYEGKELYFDIHFNVKTQEFSYYRPSTMKGLPEWLPVTPFLKTGLGDYLKANSPVPAETRSFLFEYFDRLSQLDGIRGYTYYLDTLSEREMDEVVRIFNLVNKQGTPLTKADLALSHICALWPEARDTLRREQAFLAKAGFSFDLSFYVRCIAAAATESGLFEPIYRAKVNEIKESWGRAKKAIEYLLSVLRSHAYIDSSSALTSIYVLVPLVVFLANGKGKFADERERNEFLHWMYAALIWNRYSGPTETRLNQDIQALKSDHPARHLRDAIFAERGRLHLEGRDLIGASTRTAAATLAFVAARAARAVDWSNGVGLYNDAIGASNGLEYHHIFPQNLLYQPKGPYNPNASADRQRVNEIANIAFLTSAANKEIANKAPADYLPLVQNRYFDALSAQCVPQSPALWEVSRFDDFLAERRELLAGAINAYLDGLLHSRGQQRWTIQDYLRMGEGETVEFKMSLRWDYRGEEVNKSLERTVARTIAGFMSAKGGTLVVGATDDGTVCGLDADFRTLSRSNLDGWEQHLRNVLNTYLSKEVCALVDCSFAYVGDKTLAVVRAERQIRPVYLTDGDQAEFFVRSGNTTQKLDVRQAKEYIDHHFPALFRADG